MAIEKGESHQAVFKSQLKNLLVLCLILFLCSCSSTVHKGDGPPDFYVDASKIHNAIPKPEPLARFGNMPSYVVFGKRYYVMRTSKRYQAFGVASWYGTAFHARRTSSGEPYNMLAMTAAHRTLPLPTYVEVTNLENRRKVIVKVNDRGPFHSNRLIDLSYVAAKKLGMLARGTAHVAIRAIDPYGFYPPIKQLAKQTNRALKPVYKKWHSPKPAPAAAKQFGRTPVYDAKPSMVLSKHSRIKTKHIAHRQHKKSVMLAGNEAIKFKKRTKISKK